MRDLQLKQFQALQGETSNAAHMEKINAVMSSQLEINMKKLEKT